MNKKTSYFGAFLTALLFAAISSLQAYDFTVDIKGGEKVVGANGVSPFGGSVYIGYFDAGTNFSDPMSALDANFNVIQEGTVGAGGFQLGLAVPTGGTWTNNTLSWSSQEPSDWDSTFSGQDIIAVFLDTPVQSDGFGATPLSFDSATEYLIVDTGANFQNATTSGLTTTFALLESTVVNILKRSNQEDVVLDTGPGLATFDITSVAPASAEEGTAAVVAIERSGVDTTAVTVDLTLVDGASSVLDTDFQFDGEPASTPTVTVTFLATETVKNVTINRLERPGYQGDRDFMVQLGNPQPPADADLGTEVDETVTIEEDDTDFGTVAFDPGDVTVSISETGVAGNGQSAALTITRSGSTSFDGDVDVAFTLGGAAVQGTDFSIAETSPVTIPQGSASTTVNVTALNEAVIDSDVDLTVTLDSATVKSPVDGTTIGGVLGGSNLVSTVSILNDDVAGMEGQLQLSQSSYNVFENAGFVNIVVTRTGGVVGPASGDVDTSVETGDTAVAGTDFTNTSAGVSFAAGSDVPTPMNVQVPIIDNNVEDGNRTFTVTLGNVTGASSGSPLVAKVTIFDEDEAGTFGFTESSRNVVETDADQILTFTIERTVGSDGPLDVTVNTVGGTAVAGTDFEGISGLVVPFADGETSKTVDVVVKGDNVFTLPSRTFQLTLAVPGGSGADTATDTVDITITEDETPAPGAFVFDPTVYTYTEAGGTAVLTIKRQGGSDLDVSVDYTVNPGTAVPPGDYTDPGTTTLDFLAGETEKQIVITLVDDDIFEDPETFTVTLSNATNGATVGAAGTATVTIANDDDPAAFSLNDDAFTVNEGGSVTITVTRSGGASGQSRQIWYTTANGSAIAGQDYTAKSGILDFAGNGSQNVTVETLQDEDSEDPETFFFQLQLLDPSDITTRLAAPSQATIEITRNLDGGDTDQPDMQVSEGSGQAFASKDMYSPVDNPIYAAQNRTPGSKHTFIMRVENDSPLTDNVTLTGFQQGSAVGGTAVYKLNGRDITSQVESGAGYELMELRPGQKVDIEVVVRLPSYSPPKNGYAYAAQITATSENSGTSDTVGAFLFSFGN